MKGQGTPDEATLRDYLNVVLRRKWVIAKAMVLVPAAALVFSLLQTPRYEASAQVLLSRQNLANTLAGIQDPTAYTQADRIAQTQADLARVPDIARKVLDELELSDRTPTDFLDQSSVTPSQNADLLTFRVTDTDAALAVRLTSVYAKAYTTYRRNLDTNALETARREVQKRIEALPKQSGPLYASLVDKEQQLRTLEALQTSNAYVIRRPTEAEQVAPRPVRNVALGIVLGVALGIGLAFLREALDTRIRSTEEIGERLGVPLLARIPEPPKRLRELDRLAMLHEPSGAQAEAFRMLRTSLDFATLDRDVRTIMVTSAVEQEGKSTTVANLAVALARAGQRVILVDLDLRRPSIERFFELRGRPGVTQLVLGRVSLADALRRVPVVPLAARLGGHPNGNGSGNGAARGRLAVLGSGPIPPDPGEFVSSHGLSEVLAELREIADVVLVDAPPLLHVGDALTLSAKVDGVIVVTRMEALRRPMLTEVRRVLETMPTTKLGFVATGALAAETYQRDYGYDYTLAPQAADPAEAEAERVS